MHRVVIDTNVVISGFLKEGSPPARILTLVERGLLQLCATQEIVEEYRGVIKRERFAVIRDKAHEYLTHVSERIIWITPGGREPGVCDDPEDEKFLACAVAAEAAYLITGNTKHFPRKKYRRTAIVTPREMVDITVKTLFRKRKGE